MCFAKVKLYCEKVSIIISVETIILQCCKKFVEIFKRSHCWLIKVMNFKFIKYFLIDRFMFQFLFKKEGFTKKRERERKKKRFSLNFETYKKYPELNLSIKTKR